MHALVSILGTAVIWSFTQVHSGIQPGQMAHLAFPKTIFCTCLSAHKPSSLANKVRKSFGGEEGRDKYQLSQTMTKSILVVREM